MKLNGFVLKDIYRLKKLGYSFQKISDYIFREYNIIISRQAIQHSYKKRIKNEQF